MIKVILPAKEIPLGSTVTMVKGSKEYTLEDRLVIHNAVGKAQQIKASDGAFFVIDGTNQIKAIGEDLELVWVTDRESLSMWLDPEEDK